MLAGDEPNRGEQVVLDRLRARGAFVSLVPAARASPSELARSSDVAVLLAGASTEVFESEYAAAALPLVFADSELLRSGARLATLRGRAAIESVLLEETPLELTRDLPAWGIRYFEEPESVDTAIGSLGEGVASAAVELRRNAGPTSNRVVVIADEGSRFLGGAAAPARVASFAAANVENLSGYGRELFDRVVSWAAGRPAVAFVRGDADGDEARNTHGRDHGPSISLRSRAGPDVLRCVRRRRRRAPRRVRPNRHIAVPVPAESR